MATSQSGLQGLQGSASAGGSNDLRLCLGAIKNAVLVYSKVGGQGDTLPCNILQYDAMLLQQRPLVRWKNSVSCHSEFFCCYKLCGDDSVKQIKSACSLPNTKGIVLVNESGSITDPCFWDEDIGIPMCIVSSAVCEDLLSLLELGTDRHLRSHYSENEVIMKVSPVDGVLDYKGSQENGKLDFFFPFARCDPIKQWTLCTHLVLESIEEFDKVLYLCPYENLKEVQEFKSKLRSLNPNIGGIVAFNVTNDSKGQDYQPWLVDDPPLYIVGKEDGQKLLELSRAQDAPVEASTIIPPVPPTESRLLLARILPVFGEMSYLRYNKENAKMNFQVFANRESNEAKCPPFARHLRCVDACKPANLKPPFLIYHFLKESDTNKELYRAIHTDNRLQASGVLVINWKPSISLDPSFFRDRKEARSFLLPLIVVGFRSSLEYDLKGNKKPDITLCLKEAKLNCGEEVTKSPTVKVFNPKVVNISADLNQILLPNERQHHCMSFLRILHYSEGVTYSSVFNDVEEDVRSGGLAGVLLYSQVDDKVQSKDLKLPVGFYNAERDSRLLEIPLIGMTHSDAMNLLYTKKSMPSNTTTSESKGYFQRLGDYVGSGVKKFFRISSFPICEILRSIEWTKSTPQSAYDEVEAKLKDWEHVDDKDKAITFLKGILLSTGLKHLPVHILAAWSMRKNGSIQKDYLQEIFDVAKNEKINAIVESMRSYKWLSLRQKGFAYLKEAAASFIDRDHNQHVQCFWITLFLYIGYLQPKDSSKHWEHLYSKESSIFVINEINCSILQKWIVVGREVGLQSNCCFNHLNLSELVSRRSFVEFTSARMLIDHFQKDVLNTSGRVQIFLKTLRQGRLISKMPFGIPAIEEGAHFLHDIVMVGYLTGNHNDGGLVNEMEKWWREIVGKLNLLLPRDTIQCLNAIRSILSQSECGYSPKMMEVVENELVQMMSSDRFLESVTLDIFYALYDKIDHIPKQVILKILSCCDVSVAQFTTEQYLPLINGLLKRFNDSEMFTAVSDLITRTFNVVSTPENCTQLFNWLLHAKIPLLFSPEVRGIKSISHKFQVSLQRVIEVKDVRKEVQHCFLDWMVQDEKWQLPIQQLTLNAMLPSLSMYKLDLRTAEKFPNTVKSFECLQAVMKKLLFYYKSNDSPCWLDPKFPCTMYWKIIGATVTGIMVPPIDITEWCQKCQHVIQALSGFYSQAVELGQLDAPLWKTYKPAKEYISWVNAVIQAIEDLERKIKANEWTKDFMEKYTSFEASISEVAQCVHTSIAIPSPTELLGEMGKACVCIVDTVLKKSDTDIWISVFTVLERFEVQLDKSRMQQLFEVVDPQLLKEFDGSETKDTDSKVDLLIFKKQFTMKSLLVAADAVAKTFQPADASMNALVYFFSKKGRLFDKFMRSRLEKVTDRSVQVFADCLNATVAFLQKITTQKVEYKELRNLQFFHLTDSQKQNEIELLRDFSPAEGKGVDFLAAFKDMTDLVSLVEKIPLIQHVCEMCGLSNCLKDPHFEYLVEIRNRYDTDEAKDALNSQIASDAMKEIRPILPLNFQQLELFAQIAENRDFYQFIEEIEHQGKSRFRSLYSLITSILQHEEYNDEVLNQLPIAREYMLPFLNKDQDFQTLVTRVSEVSEKARGEFWQLEVMKRNINLVHMWFSKAMDQSLESVVQDLQQVMSKGRFSISSQIGMLCECLSTYQVSSSGGREQVGSNAVISEEWIDDFNRRLGLLEKIQDQSMSVDSPLRNIELFQQTFKRVKKMSLLWIEMRSLACPYLESEVQVQCNASSEELDEIHSGMMGQLSNWKKSLAELRMKFKELLLFTIPKVNFIFEAIKRGDHELLLKEVAHIFLQLPEKKTAEQQKQHIVMALDLNVPVPATSFPGEIPDSLDSFSYPESGPFRIVGNFLHNVVGKGFLEGQKYSMQKVVHLLPGRSQKEVLTLLFSIYGRIPHSFEVYHCRRSTTDKELQFIYERAKAFKMTVCILNVNMLSLRLQEILLKLHRQSLSDESVFGIHYTASGASIIQDLPQVEVRKVTTEDDSTTRVQWEELRTMYNEVFAGDERLKGLELVYGHPGDGKSHYIHKRMSAFSHSAILTFDESFSVEEAICKLRQLSLQASAAIYLNFTLLPSSETSSAGDKEAYKRLVTKIQWFLFDLFFLGYVEDVKSGLSFSFIRGLQWSVYVEVPNKEFHQHNLESGSLTIVKDDPTRSLEEFMREFPVLALLGKLKHIDSEIPLDIDDDAQLVCKYIKAFCRKRDRRNGIDRKFFGHAQEKVSFAKLPDVSVRECRRLLKLYTPENARVNKMYQIIFVKYMARRCRFLEKCPSYNYNSYETDVTGEPQPFILLNEDKEEITIDTSSLGSSLFETMLQEVNDFSSARRRSNWEGDARQQLVYVLDGIEQDGEEGGSFEIVALKPDEIPEEEKKRFQKIQISLHNRYDLETRDVLDRYIASAFGLKLTGGRLVEIDKKNYVLTLDFALKMLEINERYWARIPVIIEGETGVGKTFLVEMMADLWNGSLMHRWKRIVVKLWTLLQKLALEIIRCVDYEDDQDYSDEDSFIGALGVLGSSCDRLEQDIMTKVDENVVELIPQGGATLKMMKNMLQYAADCQIETNSLNQELIKLVDKQPLIHLLKVPSLDQGKKSASQKHWVNLDSMLVKQTGDPQTTAENLFKLLMEAEVDVFHRISIHGSLTTEDMRDFFTPIISQAKKVEQKWINPSTCPSITVFLDEINTSSCPGLMKEILVDRSLHGEKLPKSIFVIGACNPHRGHSVVMHEKIEDAKKWEWVKGSYYVHRMHQSVRYLLWDYGALDERQEENYIKAKMAMVMGINASRDDDDSNDLMETLSDKVAESQNLMRTYAAEHYLESKKFSKTEAEELSRSCVSQRDIQRVFTFYVWLLKTYKMFRDKEVHDHPATYESFEKWQERAVMVSLGLTYFFRLSTHYRERYCKAMNFNIVQTEPLSFSEALKNEMDFYCDIVHLPPGIAKTQALKENLFCVVACCCTKMPLIIVGEPGSSKTLSFNIAASNFKGSDSKQELLKDTNLFSCFDPHYYQCSRTTTSKEVEVVFQRALKRQEAVSKHQYDNFQNIVFMDEAGLPEESLESLKVLHKYLDNPQVSFVGITNHILDAAKTNRTVTLFRPRADKDVQELAHGCFGITESTDEHIRESIHRLCYCYSDLMSREESFKHFFGLRDFIHFMNYLRRQTDRNVALLGREDYLAVQVTRSVERNFNGHESMDIVHSIFGMPEGLVWRNIIEVLLESLDDKPRPIFIDDQEDFEEVRYKLIIDPTEDDSSRRLMMMYEILNPQQTTTVIGSDFSDDGYLQNINNVSKITNAASSGATVLMMQTDDIHESFYDLFNQHFRKIKVGTQKGEKQTHFFANVAIGSHSKPCRVNHEFQCLVIIKDSELAVTPAPFLNRFEKYRLSTTCFLEASLHLLPPLLRKTVEDAKRLTWLPKDAQISRSQPKPFVNQFGEASFFGFAGEDTINSLLLIILPKSKFTPMPMEPLSNEWMKQPATDVVTSLLILVVEALQKSGFDISMSEQDVAEDAAVLSDMLPSCEPVVSENISYNHELFDTISEAWSALISEDYAVGLTPPSVTSLQTFVANWIHMWIVRKLLQLFTQEALILHKRTLQKKYSWFLKAYLDQHNQLDITRPIKDQESQSSKRVISKLVCLTRSFQAFSKLTSQADDDFNTEDESHTQLCMLSAISSQQEFSDELLCFTESTQKTVLIILANMFEASKKLINYVRLRIDEVDEGWQGTHEKTFVVLLYFPTSVSQIYPAMFFYGWNFHYLDSLDLQKSTEYTAQLKYWCMFAYLTSSTEGALRSHLQRSFSLEETCNRLLIDCASVLTARVTLRLKDGAVSSNKKKKVMFEKLLKSDLGEKLVSMYLEYWSMSPSKVARVLHGIAVFSNQLKSLHSVTDLFQVFFESTFHNFMAYMFHHINEELNLSTFDSETSELFVTLTKEMVERPKTLASIKSYSNTWGVRQATPGERMHYEFPAFNKVFPLLEKYLESLFSEATPDNRINSMEIAGLLLVQCEGSQVLSNVLRLMDKHDHLWRRYEKDLCSKLHLSEEDREIIGHFMASRDPEDKTNVARLVDLHYVAYANPIDFSYLRKLMRPLLTIQSASSQPISMKAIIECVLSSGHTHNEELAEIIVISLERYLSECDGDKKMLLEWQNAFNDVCKEKELESALYSSEKSQDPVYRSRFLCVKSVFILMQSHSAPDEEYCKSVWIFHRLIQEEQKQCEEKGLYMGLGSVLSIINKPQTGYFRQPSDNILPVFLPELLQHVFHPSLTTFDDAEVMAFLEYVSKLPFSATHGPDVTISLKALNQIMLLILTAGLAPERRDCDSYGISKGRKMLVYQVLTRDHPAINYLPPFIKTSEDMLLAHLYFFSMTTHINHQTADLKKKANMFISAIKAMTSQKGCLESIEYHVYIYMVIMELASELADPKKLSEIEKKNKDKFFSNILCKTGNSLEYYRVFEVLMKGLMKEQAGAKTVMQKLADWLKVTKEVQRETVSTSVSDMMPHFWRKDDILQVLQGRHSPSQKLCAQLLSRLLDIHKKLVMEAKFLPVMVEFCMCLKSLLDFKVDEKAAKQLNIKTAVERACEEIQDSNKKDRIRQLLKEFKEYFNEWRGGNRAIVEITGDTLLESILLTGSSMEQCHTIQVLNSIINSHNSVLQKAYDCCKQNPHFMKWFPKPAEIKVHELQNLKHLFCKPPTEVHLLDCMRQCLPVMGRSTGDGCVEKMCITVMREFLVGTPTIELPSPDTIQDMFGLNMKSGERNSNFVFSAELAAVRKQLDGRFQNFKEPFPKKDILAHFHSADHSLLEGIVKGLLLVAHYLTQEKRPEEWTLKTLDQFVKHVDETSLSHMMNMTRSTDLRVLESLKVGFLEYVLELFVKWMETGFCDYHSLPLGAKKDPEFLESSCDVVTFLQEKMEDYEQKENLCRLEDVILPDAMGLTMGDFEMSVFEKPLQEYVTNVRLLKATSPLLKLIPAHLQLKHYVYFMIQLRRINVEHQNSSISASTTDAEESSSDDEAESDLLNLSAIFSKDHTTTCESEEESDESDEGNTSVDDDSIRQSDSSTEYNSAEEGQEMNHFKSRMDPVATEDPEDKQEFEEVEESFADMDDSMALQQEIFGSAGDDESEDETSSVNDKERVFQKVPREDFTPDDVHISRDQSDITMEDVEDVQPGDSEISTAELSVKSDADRSPQLTQLYGDHQQLFGRPQQPVSPYVPPDPLHSPGPPGVPPRPSDPPQPSGDPPLPPEGPPQPLEGPPLPPEGPPQPLEHPPQPLERPPQPIGDSTLPLGGPPQPTEGPPQSPRGPQPFGDHLQQQQGSSSQSFGSPQQMHGVPQHAVYNQPYPQHPGYPQSYGYQPPYPTYPYYGYQPTGYPSMPQGYQQPYRYPEQHGSLHPQPPYQYQQQYTAQPTSQTLSGHPPIPSTASEGTPQSMEQKHERGKTMTTAEVVQWLEEIGLGEYKELFEKEGVNGSLLAELDMDDLEEMGVSKKYHRKKLITKFKEL